MVYGKGSARTHVGCGSSCGVHVNEDYERPGLQDCTLHYYNQTVDHFSWGLPSGGSYYFQQRYYICGMNNWVMNDTYSGPIFFYTGNEGDVTLYVNNTGLMWESAPEFGMNSSTSEIIFFL